MKMLVIQGSPRPAGNTATVLDAILAPARAGGHTIEEVRACDLPLHGCTECFACQEVLDEPGCSQQDAVGPVIGKIREADLVIWAFPVFCWGWPAPIKCVLDRLYAVHKFKVDPYKVLIEGKKMALVVTAGGDEYDGADVAVMTYEKFVAFARCKSVGRFVAGSLGDPEATKADADLARRAKKFGESLIA
jgi:multimeric flavodoxin WrbA